MKAEIEQIEEDALAAIAGVEDLSALEEVKVKFLGKKGSLTQVAAGMRHLSNEEKPVMGQALNAARGKITQAMEAKESELQAAEDLKLVEGVDVTLPGRAVPRGGLHPLTIVKDRAIQVLRRMGFALAEGPEIETEFHCFDALNTPEDHPARNEKDTFYFDSGKLLRTHTSSVQVRSMESGEVPLRIIAPGSAYRRDEIDATHLSVFNQLEGLFVAEDVKLADLKGTLEYFLKAMFGEKTAVRFRPHFFPFTEPSFEIDVELVTADGSKKWIEVAGCGMVDPAVFSQVSESRGDAVFAPEAVTGFAFGMGLDRLAMIEWGIGDIRALVENDVRFLEQFA